MHSVNNFCAIQNPNKTQYNRFNSLYTTVYLEASKHSMQAQEGKTKNLKSLTEHRLCNL